MSTLQAIVYALFEAFATVLPISEAAHRWFISYLTGWPPLEGTLAGVLSAGTLLAVLVYFRHDWMSIISSSLSVVLFWKKPMTIDERMPLFIFFSTLPFAGAWFYVDANHLNLEFSPLWVAGFLVISTVPMLLADRISRRARSMFDWNWIDALLLGFSQLLYFVPGAGRQMGALSAGWLRNYHKDAAVKFAFFTLLPILLFQIARDLKDFSFRLTYPAAGITWITLSVAFVIAFLASLLAINALVKNMRTRGLGSYVLYRLVFAGAVLLAHFRN